LAGALLCREPTGTACGACADCTSFAGGNHPDFLLVDPTTTDGEPDRDGGVLRAEQADAVLHFTVMKPFQSRFRVALIRELQRATPAFANHLLKTFEEPPAAALLLATATDTSAILPTLVSRCQTLKLRPSSRDILCTALQTRWGAESERADLLSRLAQGRMGWAVLQLENARMWQRRDRNRALATDLAASSIPERLARADALAVRSSPAQLQEQVDFWLWWWRDVWLIQHDRADGCVNVDCEDELESLAARVRATDVTAFLQRLERAIQQMRANVNGRLVMTSLMIHMPMAA
jgi:DNA polymerase-3 subunit delta'